MWRKMMNRPGNTFLCLCATLLLAAGQGRAETDFWFDNFETNAASHWVSTGVWHIGSPTAGPAINSAGFRAHSAAHCASTQSYPYSQDARMVCVNYNGSSSFVVPATNQFPRLRFWHWFNYANALGYVEISTNNGTSWIQISPTYENITGGGVWSRPSIDLSPFAGQSAQIAFHFTSGCCTGNALGWYVDDVAVVTNAPVLNNPESFESGPNTNDWAVDAGTWEIGMPASGPNAAHTGINCAGTILAGNYPNNVDSRLISPAFTVPSSTNQALCFWHWYNFNNASGYVEVRVGNGSWTQLSPAYLNGNSGGVWSKVSLDLSSYAGQTVQAAFHFTSGGVYSAAGWYVDDISVVAAPVLIAPATRTIYAGETLNATNYAVLYPSNGTPKFALVSPTIFTNLNLNATNGVLTWTTTTAQPPGTNTIIVKVTDANTPPLSTTNSFEVVVVNPWVPVLTVPGPQAIYAGQPLVVTNYATNPFFPGSTFTFALLSGLTNAEANLDVSDLPTDGVLRWTTTTALPAGTYANVIKVTNNNAPYYSATNSFLIVVSNPPLPVLTVPSIPLTVYVGRQLDVTNISATNSAFPDCTFTFETNSAPAGVSIDPATGELRWRPAAAQAPNIYTISVKVTDDNLPPLGAIGSFLVIVSPTPPPPTLMVPGTQTNHAGQTLPVTILATNTYLPDSVFTFSLPSPSTNYSIGAASGVLTWTNTGIINGVLTWTNNSVSPGTNLISVIVSDDSVPALSATNSFKLVFLPPLPPSLIVPATQTVYAGQTLAVSLFATNAYLPDSVFTFSLPSPSTNYWINAISGVLTWTNTAALPGANQVSVKVTDNSVPPLSATNSFAVIVTPTPPVLTNLLAGSSGFQFGFNTLSNTTWRIDATTNLNAATTWLPLFTNTAGASGTLQFTDLLATNFPLRFYRAVFRNPANSATPPAP
jgi:hypothetical protein